MADAPSRSASAPQNPAQVLASALPKPNRRTFLSLAGVLAASAALSRLPLPAPASAMSTDPGLTMTPSFCEMCFWKCGIDVWKNTEGQVVKITGSQDHPLSNGRLCPRGTGGMGNLYDPDRIKKPMLRKGDTWQEVSWEEALGFVATRMQDLKSKYGPASMALVNHGHGASFLRHLFQAFGAPVVSAPSFAQCRGARDTAYVLTYGTDIGSPEYTDLENTRFLVFIGYHLGENMHNTQVQEFAAAVEKGLELVVVDPRFSVAAGKAKHWLPIKPGTDLALLLSWIHVLITEGIYNRPFVEASCLGLEQLQAAVAPYSPEWAYTETGIPPEQIREVARRMAMYGPQAMIHPGRRTNWYGDDTQRLRALAILNALLGNWGTQGGFFIPGKFNVGKYPNPPYPEQDKSFEELVKKTFPFAEEVPTQFLRDHIRAEGDPKIKGMLVYGSDLLNNIPYPDQTLEALKKLELLVVVETMPIELTGWADVVLPDTTYLERYDDLANPPWKIPYVALRQPVVEPLFDSKPSWWIARELGLKLGLEAYFPWKTIEEYLETRLKSAGLSLEQLKSKGVIRQAQVPMYTQTPTFKTPSGKIELYSERLAAAGFDPLPKYTPPEVAPPGFFRLLIGRVSVHSFGRTTNNRVLGELYAENEVWVNALTARDLGLKSGTKVVLKNQDGVTSNPVRVRVTQRIRPDCVWMAHGFGRKTAKMGFAHGRGASDNDLITRVVTDRIMGGTSTNTSFVSFVPAPVATGSQA